MKEFYRRHLPHWQPRNAVFFVTFRLKNSLPDDVIKALREEREHERNVLIKLPESERIQQNYLEAQRYFARWNAYLDRAEFGPRWLSQSEIAEIVKEAMHYRDGKAYDLQAFCIMSNHVHAVFEPCRSECHSDLPKIMQSLKRHTARQANKFLAEKALSGRTKAMIV